MKNIYSKLLALAIAAGAVAWAQEPARAVAPPFNEASNLPLQRIGVDDLIGISVYDSPELTRAVRVDADGAIRLPMLSREIRAVGLLPKELERIIVDCLKSEHVFVNPIVTVSVVEYRSRPISVVGAVKRPITFQATGTVTLLEALARADGLSETAGSELLISGLQTAPSTSHVPISRRIAIRDLVEGSNPELNVRLIGGEEIRVPEAGRVYVVGNVKRPGAFVIRDSSSTTVLKVLALSEGLIPYATKVAYIYRQEGGAGGKNEIPIELKKIMDRKTPDVALMANDILYVPDRTGRRNLASVMEKVVTLGGGLGAAVIYTAR